MNTLFRKKTVEQITADAASGYGDGEAGKMNKTLTVRDLTSFGVAAIIGAGIFSTVGQSCFDGGPGVIFLFMITAVTCGFSAMCYAEFASRIPVSGSAYTYSYASFGELIAWIIGWDLIMEYAIGNIVVAASWSSNLVSFLDNISTGIREKFPSVHINLHIPEWLATPWRGAYVAHQEIISGSPTVNDATRALDKIWMAAPHIGSMPIILNVPALIITIFITALVYIGISESRKMSNAMVAFKLIVIVLVVCIGFFYVNTANWNPFLPNGFSGVMKGVSAVFFAYIGFDAISTTAEECKNPQRDLPRGMIASLIICTVLYILVALVLTGMVNYSKLNVGDFLASAFTQKGLNWLGGILALSAVIATTSVMLVFQLGQPRIWMTMSRDGLLPKRFSKLHPKYKTPGFSTVLTGVLVGIPALVLDSDLVTNLTSIGTLFAFVLVCGGILLLPRAAKEAGKFRVPYVNSRWIAPALFAVTLVLVLKLNGPAVADFYHNQKLRNPSELVAKLSPQQKQMMGGQIAATKSSIAPSLINYNDSTLTAELGLIKSDTKYRQALSSLPYDAQYMHGTDLFWENLPFHLFVIISIILTIFSFKNRWSLIPVLGMTSCFYLLTELGITNWIRFVVWLIVGLAIYFAYGRRKSHLAKGTPLPA